MSFDSASGSKSNSSAAGSKGQAGTGYTNPNNNPVPGTEAYAQKYGGETGQYVIGGHVYNNNGPVRVTNVSNTLNNRNALDQAGIKYYTNGNYLTVDANTLQNAISQGNTRMENEAGQGEGAAKEYVSTNQIGPKNYEVDLAENLKVGDNIGSEKSIISAKLRSLESEQNIEYGGIMTPQARALGNRYGWDAIGKSLTKPQLQRGSSLEIKVEDSEAANALTIYPSNRNESYYTPKAKIERMGGVMTPQAKGKSYGWSFFGNELIRNSAAEEKEISSQSTKASKLVKNTSNPKANFVNLSENVGFDEMFSANMKGGSGTMSQQDFTKMLSEDEQKGAVFELLSPGGQVIGKTSGQRSYYDYLQAENKYGNGVKIAATYPDVENELVASVKKNPEAYANEPNSFWNSLGKAGYLTESGFAKINKIFSDYYISQQPTSKQTVLNNNSTIAEDLQKSASESYQGHYLDTKLAHTSSFGIPYEIPTFLGQELEQANEGLSKPAPFPKSAEEAGQNFFAFFGQGLKSMGPMFVAGATELSDIALGNTKGKGAIPKVAHNPSAVLEGIAYPGDIMSEHAKETEQATASGIHGAAKATHTSGLLPNFVKNPETAGATFGTLAAIGLTVYSLKSLSPLKSIKTGYKVELGTGVVKPLYSGIYLDFFGKQREVIGSASGKLRFGKPTEEEYQPLGSKQFIEKPGRGYEPSTPHDLERKIITSEKFQTRKYELNPSNREAENPGLEMKLQKNMENINNILSSNEKITNKVYSDTLKTGGREGISQQVIEGGLVGTGKKQGFRSAFNPFTGKSGLVQGSTGLPRFLNEDLSPLVHPHDIDVIKSNIAGIGEEYQAKNLAKFINNEIQTRQGILPKEGKYYRGMNGKKANLLSEGSLPMEETSSTTEIYGSPTADVAAYYGKLYHGKDYGVVSFELEGEKILDYGKIPKSISGRNPIKKWYESNPKMIEYAKSKGYNAIVKPLRTGGKEIIVLDPKLFSKINKINPDIQFTRVEGRRIFTNEGEKALEVVTRKDEPGSSSKPSGSVYGREINRKGSKAKIEGTNNKVKTTLGSFQLVSNVAKNAFQNEESALAQSANKRQLGMIGKGEFFGPELFAAKAITRPYLQVRNFVGEAYKTGNKATIKKARSALSSIHETVHYQLLNEKTNIYNPENLPLDKLLSEDIKGLSKEQEQSVETSTLGKGESGLASGLGISGKSAMRLGFGGREKSGYSKTQSEKAKSSLTSPTSQMQSSILSGFNMNSKSLFSSSDFSSSKNSPLSSRLSVMSSISTKSANSAFSGKSSKSRSIFSIGSSKSGSARNSKSIINNSPLSPRSGGSRTSKSGLSGSSGFGSSISGGGDTITYNPPSTTPILPILDIGWNHKLKYKGMESHTKTKRLSVNNVFAGSLSIKGE